MRRSITVAALAGLGLAALDALGRGALAAPPFESAAAFLSYVDERGAIVSAFALLRLATIGVGWYLVVVASLTIAAQLIGSAALLRSVGWVTLPTVRRLLAGAAGLGISSVAVLGTITPAGAGAPPTMSDRLVEVSAASAPASSDVATMRVLSPSAPPSAAPSVAAPDGSPSTPSQRTVAPGDSFWSIASDALADAAGRPMGDREVVVYWRQLVDANRGNLVVPGDVDLIFAGQVVQLPPITAT